GLVGALSPYVPEAWSVRKQFQLDALLCAKAYWTKVETLSGKATGYGQIGRYIVLPSEYEADKATGRIAGAARFWQGATWRVLPNIPLIDPKSAPYGIVHETLSARIDPRMAAQALAGAIEKLGGDIVEKCLVQDIKNGTVITSDCTLTADHIVIAAGVDGLPLLEPFLGGKAVRGVKGQAAKLDIALPAGTPLINGEGIYIIPHAAGHVSVGSTSETSWDDPFATDALLDEVLEKACAICPALRGANVLERWAGLRPRAPKPEPMLGQLDTGVYVATGGFKTGLAVAPRVAEALADMIEGKTPDMPLDFSPQHHFSPRKK
ncbi:MAG: FAD-dependent oxidoreductase, partial [Rhodobacteraceae bacterium]|nr:FAD-dependent oxidoreductase [Paracoccaceae bacterium]